MSKTMTLKPTDLTKQLLKEMVKALSKTEMASAAGSGADIIAEDARRRAPVFEGNLRANIVSRVDRKRSKPTAYVTANYGKGKAPHAHLVEYGTVGRRYAKKKNTLYSEKSDAFFGKDVDPMPPHPFMRPAADANKEKAASAAGDAMVKMVNKKLEKFK